MGSKASFPSGSFSPAFWSVQREQGRWAAALPQAEISLTLFPAGMTCAPPWWLPGNCLATRACFSQQSDKAELCMKSGTPSHLYGLVTLSGWLLFVKQSVHCTEVKICHFWQMQSCSAALFSAETKMSSFPGVLQNIWKKAQTDNTDENFTCTVFKNLNSADAFPLQGWMWWFAA